MSAYVAMRDVDDDTWYVWCTREHRVVATGITREEATDLVVKEKWSGLAQPDDV